MPDSRSRYGALFLASILTLAWVTLAGGQTAPETAPAAQPSAQAVAWLDKLQAHSATVKSLHADLRYERDQLLEGDKQVRFGSVWYMPGPPARFAIHFNKLIADGRGEEKSQWYIFDGQWLLEKHDDEKQAFKRQIVPGAPPDKADPLDRGEGPFPLPVRLDKDRILARYNVELAPAASDDPTNTNHLVLKPRDPQHSKFNRIDFWHDKSTLLPVKIQTTDDSQSQAIVKVENPRLNQDIDPKTFDTTAPEKGWQVEVTPWEK